MRHDERDFCVNFPLEEYVEKDSVMNELLYYFSCALNGCELIQAGTVVTMEDKSG